MHDVRCQVSGLGFRLFGLCLMVLASLVVSPAVRSAERLTIFTTNYPLQYFAQHIADDLAEVRFPAPADVDPAFWLPDAETIAQYQRADIILLNGAGYANWVNKVTLPRLRTVDTSAAFKDQYIATADVLTHSHGPGGEHSHSGTAFTTWLDLSQALAQAKSIMTALVRKRPEHKAEFERNFATLEEQLLTLDAQIKNIVARNPGQPLLASHPVYQYFARRYALNLKSVLWEPDAIPGERQWTDLALTLQQHRAMWMVWEGEPNATSVARLKAMGVESLVFDPCGNRPAHGDFMSAMQENIDNLRAAYGSGQ